MNSLSREQRGLPRLLPAALAILLLSCGGDEGSDSGNTNCTANVGDDLAGLLLPKPTGRFRVGTQTRTLVDPTREEEATPTTGDPRRITVRFWYPADPCDTALRASYYTPTEARLAEADPWIDSSPAGWTEQVFAHARVRPGFVPGSEQHPVLILSHGLGFNPGDYTTFAEELASHGFVVAGINHTYDSFVTDFPEGDFVPQGPSIGDPPPPDASADEGAAWMAKLDSHISVWRDDARFVLTEIENLHAADSDGLFTGRLDLTKVGIFGHSYGGATAMHACVTDTRVKAGLSFDGGFVGPERLSGGPVVPRPFAVFVAAEYPAIDNRRNIDANFDKLADSGYKLTLAGAGHQTFSDAKLIAQYFDYVGSNSPPDVWNYGSIDAKRALAIVNAYLRAFFEKHLEDEPEPLLDGPSAEYPEITIDVKP